MKSQDEIQNSQKIQQHLTLNFATPVQDTHTAEFVKNNNISI